MEKRQRYMARYGSLETSNFGQQKTRSHEKDNGRSFSELLGAWMRLAKAMQAGFSLPA
jgi:hypothetical protein